MRKITQPLFRLAMSRFLLLPMLYQRDRKAAVFKITGLSRARVLMRKCQIIHLFFCKVHLGIKLTSFSGDLNFLKRRIKMALFLGNNTR